MGCERPRWRPNLRCLAAIEAACLALTGVATVAAQDSIEDGRRVEIPELGLSVMLPADWDVVVPMLAMPDEALRDGLRGRVPDTTLESWLDQIDTWLALWSENGLAYPEPGTGGCSVLAAVTTEPTDEVFDLRYVIANDWLGLWNDPDFEQTGGAESELAVGRVSRIDFVEHDDDGDWVSSVYRFVIDDGFGWLQCLAFESAPDDRWLSVAESLELLPAGAVPAPKAHVQFPAGWAVREPSLRDATSAVQAIDPDRKPLVRPRSAADSPDGAQSCRLVDWSLVAAGPNGYRELTDALTGDILAGQGAERQTIVDSALVDLPGGRAARVDSLVDRTTLVSRWHFTDGEAWFYLSCAADEPPVDRWRSIAETFRIGSPT